MQPKDYLPIIGLIILFCIASVASLYLYDRGQFTALRQEIENSEVGLMNLKNEVVSLQGTQDATGKKLENLCSDKESAVTSLRNNQSVVGKRLDDLNSSLESSAAGISRDINNIKQTLHPYVATGFSDDEIKGTYVNNPGWADGYNGAAWQFDGSGQRILLKDTMSDAYDNLSISCWIKHATSSWQSLVERGAWDNRDGVALQMDYNRTSVSFGHYFAQVKSKVNVQDDQWHFVVGTISKQGSGYVYSIYVDGKLDNSMNCDVGVSPSKDSWSIGARYDGSWAYRGLVEDVRFFNKALTDEEVDKLYTTGPSGE
jgi:hypothetical protein